MHVPDQIRIKAVGLVGVLGHLSSVFGQVTFQIQ